MFSDPPRSAAWRHRDAREGFEVVFFEPSERGLTATGTASAIEGGVAWSVDYAIELTSGWLCTRARLGGRTTAGMSSRTLAKDDEGRWLVDGAHFRVLDGCLDVDLEASALTNAFPVHRLGLDVGASASAPAAFVRAADLGVERLEQHYERRPDRDGLQCFDYRAPAFDFRAELRYDHHGLVVAYPGLAERAA